MVSTVHWIRRIASASPLGDLVVREDLPGLGVKTEEEILDFVRRMGRLGPAFWRDLLR